MPYKIITYSSVDLLSLQRGEFFGKTQVVSTPGAEPKEASPKSWTSSPTIPRSPPSTTSAASPSVSDWHLTTEWLQFTRQKANCITSELPRNHINKWQKEWTSNALAFWTETLIQKLKHSGKDHCNWAFNTTKKIRRGIPFWKDDILEEKMD